MSKDKDHRETASYVMKAAHQVVTTERGNQHGGAEDSFQMIADLWMVYLNHTNRASGYAVNIEPKDVAMMMDLLKTARHTYGDPNNADNFIDKVGYTGLAAALAGIPVPAATAPVATQPAPVRVPEYTPPPVTKSAVVDGGGELSKSKPAESSIERMVEELSK